MSGRNFGLLRESEVKLTAKGWVHIQNDRTAYTNYYKKMTSEEQEQWPPKYWKFQLETEGTPAVRIAFTDPRR